MSVDVVVAVPAFMDMTFVGLEALPALGEERFAGDLVRSPGGGAITALGAARLGLSTALAAPIADDPAGDLIAEALTAEGVSIVGAPCSRTPVTMVMPLGADRAMVTDDPGVRARTADVAATEPGAVIVGLSQLDVVPSAARGYVSVGDDDARAFAGRLPPGLPSMAGLLIERREALVLTGASTPQQAAEILGAVVPTAVILLGGRGALAVIDGRAVNLQSFDVGAAVDTTGASDLFVAAWTWGAAHGMDVETSLRWAGLYAALSVRVPTGAAGATSLERFLEEGARRGLPAPPPRAGSRTAH
jgi:sugar/nucleoside kinase (ribokinase family)